MKKKNINVDNNCINIETIRLLEFEIFSYFHLFDNQSACAIKMCNLDKTLKNLTMNVHISDGDTRIEPQLFHKSMQVIENVLKKKYFYVLKNVNLLFKRCHTIVLDRIFKIFKENTHLLKHQFKQLNIGFRVGYNDMYHVFKWNEKIDDKYLDASKEIVLDLWDQDDCDKDENVQMKELCVFAKTMGIAR